MLYPNAYKGVKTLLFIEILGVITGFFSLFYAIFLAIQDNPIEMSVNLLKISLGLSILVGVTRFFALVTAARDESAFTKALIASVIEAGLTVLNYFTDSRLMGLLESVASICVLLFIIKGIMNLASLIGVWSVIKRGETLRKLVIAVVCSPVLMLVAALVLRKLGIVLSLLAIVILAITELVMYILYLKQAKEMLLYARFDAKV